LAEKSPVLEKTYRDYLKRVAALDLSGKQDMLGIRRTRGCDLAMQVYGLPRVPVLLVFHAADEDFGPGRRIGKERQWAKR